MRNHKFSALHPLLASLTILALGGFTQGSCFGDDDDPPPLECHTDSDCGAGFFCDYVGLPEPLPASDDDEPTSNQPGQDGDPISSPPIEPGCGEPTGVCVPLPDDCTTDSDCAPDELCIIDHDETDPVCLMYCEVGEDCCGVPAPTGRCEPAPTDECQTDADCPDGSCQIAATCAALDCPPPPPNRCVYPDPGPCPGEGDPRVSYVCTGSDCWVIGGWICPAGQNMFSNECGGGCIDTDACDGLDELTCEQDEICVAAYGPSWCDANVCTDDYRYQDCTRAF